MTPAAVAERVSGERLNARYEGGWYYCWLIERRDRPQPEWFGADCMWHKNATEAKWYARKSDADTCAGEMFDIDVIVCEHGFMLGEAGPDELLDARAEIADSAARHAATERNACQLAEQLDAARAEIARLRMNLRLYSRHLEACSIDPSYRFRTQADIGKRNCNCGLDTALKEAP